MASRSLFSRMMLPVIPLVAMGFTVSFMAWKSLSSSTGDLRKSMSLAENAQKAKLYASEMSDAMRGFLLDPSNAEEARRKGEADEKLGAILTEMRKAASGEVVRHLEELKEFDEKQLNPSEDKVLALVKEGKLTEAQRVYRDEYAPMRKKYNQIADSVVSKAEEQAEHEFAAIESAMDRARWVINGLLAACVVLVAGMLTWIARSLARDMSGISDRFNAEARGLASSSGEALQSGESLADSVREQGAAIHETMAAIEEINATLAKTATGAERSRETAQRSESTVKSGQEAVARMAESMEHIKKNSDETAERIAANNKDISGIQGVIAEIGEKTKVINEIVFQTKLLSFNASVEAARAGEHGKGFAVVAEEIGNLASMSGRAANEISALLQSSLARVNEIVDKSRAQADELMSRGTAAVDEGKEVARSCGEAFEAIRRDFDSIRGSLVEIASATQEQAQGMKEVEKAVSELDRATQAASSVADRSGALASQLNVQASKMRTLTHELDVTVKGSRAAGPADSPGHAESAGSAVGSDDRQQVSARRAA